MIAAYGPPVLLAADTTTTTMPNLVGDPLETGWILFFGLLLLVVIVVGGLWVGRRTRRD